jgi:hypothetical protein
MGRKTGLNKIIPVCLEEFDKGAGVGGKLGQGVKGRLFIGQVFNRLHSSGQGGKVATFYQAGRAIEPNGLYRVFEQREGKPTKGIFEFVGLVGEMGSEFPDQPVEAHDRTLAVRFGKLVLLDEPLGFRFDRRKLLERRFAMGSLPGQGVAPDS